MYKAAGRFVRDHGLKPRRNLTMYDAIRMPKHFRNRPKVVPAPESQKLLYMVRLTLIRQPALSFIKIGISGAGLEARFRQDARNYSFEQLALSATMTEGDALAIETAFHEVYHAFHFRSPVPLASGNTECYRMPDEALPSAIAMIAAQRGRSKPMVAQDDAPPIGGGVKPRKAGGYYRHPVGKAERGFASKKAKRND
jgi:hypothetical protein